MKKDRIEWENIVVLVLGKQIDIKSFLYTPRSVKYTSCKEVSKSIKRYGRIQLS